MNIYNRDGGTFSLDSETYVVMHSSKAIQREWHGPFSASGPHLMMAIAFACFVLGRLSRR